ncbi:hypothetical protein PMAYCL1PPCAC_18577, partial [Pristionchus mayeri]
LSTSFKSSMKTLFFLSVLTGSALGLFRSSSYSYSYGSPYYSSSNYYSDNYYTIPYRSNSRYASEEHKSYTYMDGSSRPTVSKDEIVRAAKNQADSARVIQSSSSFTAGKLRYFWGTQYMPSQECGSDSGKRSKRSVDGTFSTIPYSRSDSYFTDGVKERGTTRTPPSLPYTSTSPPPLPYSRKNSSPPLPSDSSIPSYPSISFDRSTSPSPYPKTATYTRDFIYINDSIHKAPIGDNGNFSDFKDTLAYLNMFYVNFTDPVSFFLLYSSNGRSEAESLNYVETYLPDNFTSKSYSNSSSMMTDAMSNLPLNVSDRATELAKTMMGGNIEKSANDWYKDIKDEREYKELIGSSNGSGPVQTYVGCSENSAFAVCTRSISDLDSSLYSYIFNSAIPSEIAWQCPDKDYYCCEWECCKEKKCSVAGIIFCIIFSLLAFSCCMCCCCLCLKGKKKEKETLVVMYPKPQPQAYFISVPPRVYY